MIHGKRIVRVPRQHLLELLHRTVIVEVVKVIERYQVLRIMRTEGERFRVRVRRRRQCLYGRQNTQQKYDSQAWQGPM